MWTLSGVLNILGLGLTMYCTFESFHNFQCTYLPINPDIIKAIHNALSLPIPEFE